MIKKIYIPPLSRQIPAKAGHSGTRWGGLACLPTCLQNGQELRRTVWRAVLCGRHRRAPGRHGVVLKCLNPQQIRVR